MRPYEISIEVSEDTLRSYGLSLEQIANAVRASSIDLPGGSVRTEAGEVLIRAEGKQRDQRGLREYHGIHTQRWHLGQLRDIATVIDGFEDVDVTSRFDGRPAVVVNVFRVGEQDTLIVAGAVKRYLEEASRELPPGVEVEIWNDTSVMLAGRLDLLKRNGIAGLILVFIVLALFLRPSLAFLVSVGIPVSFAGAIWMMPTVGISINMITLFAFILVLGIVVDDAIVVGENVYSRMRKGEHPREASWKGHPRGRRRRHLRRPHHCGRLHTDAHGHRCQRQDLAQYPADRHPDPDVLATAVEADPPGAPGLPATVRPGPQTRALMRAQHRISRGLERFVEVFYRPLLRIALNARYVTLTIFLAVLGITVSFVLNGHIKSVFFPEVEAEIISAKLTLPNGVPFETTTAGVLQIEAAVGKLNERYTTDPAKPLVLRALTSVGSQPFKTGFNPVTPKGVNLGEVTIELAKGGDRDVTAKEIAAVWRELTGRSPARSNSSSRLRRQGAATPSTWNWSATTPTRSTRRSPG